MQHAPETAPLAGLHPGETPPAPRTIVAAFNDFTTARRALLALLDAGVPRDHLGLLRRGDTAETDLSSEPAAANVRGTGGTDYQPDATPGDTDLDAGSAAVIGGSSGAVIGGIAGGLLAGLAGIAIPGAGALFGLGPIAGTIMATLGVGAVSGSVAGALLAHGVHHEDATYFQQALDRGGTLLTIHTDESVAGRIAALLATLHPVRIADSVAAASASAPALPPEPLPGIPMSDQPNPPAKPSLETGPHATPQAAGDASLREARKHTSPDTAVEAQSPPGLADPRDGRLADPMSAPLAGPPDTGRASDPDNVPPLDDDDLDDDQSADPSPHPGTTAADRQAMAGRPADNIQQVPGSEGATK